MRQPRLDGKVAVVTGAGGGLGAAMALALSEAGAHVLGVDWQTKALEQQATTAKARGCADRFMPVFADISDVGQCEWAVAHALRLHGQLDILVNNAAVGMTLVRPQGHKGALRFWEGDAAGWQKLMTINSSGAYFMARFATPHMLARGAGRIINVTTNFDTMLSPGRFGYGPSKAALEAGAAIWARELAGSGVTCNVLIPGRQVDTGIFPAELDRTGMLQPEIMAAPVVWLASDESAGFNGSRFVAEQWDASLPGAKAAKRIAAPIAWPQLKRRKS